jgi:hypothetical protein
MAIEELAPFIGEWDMVATFGDETGTGRSVFEWALGGAYLLQRNEAPDPAPDSLALCAPDGNGGWTQHYYDTRGVTRLYAMTFDGRVWTLRRSAPDFSPLNFHQRYVGELDGDTITGRWEASDDGTNWRVDFPLTYRRR